MTLAFHRKADGKRLICICICICICIRQIDFWGWVSGIFLAIGFIIPFFRQG